MSITMFLYVYMFSILLSSLQCCDIKRNIEDTPMDRYVSINGVAKNVTLYWKNEKTRMSAALLAVVLRHRLGYQYIYLHKEPHEALPDNEILLKLSDSSRPREFLPILRKEDGLYCPGEGIFLQRHLYVYIPKYFRNLKQCANVTKWSFFSNTTSLDQCGFFGTKPSGMDTDEIDIYMSQDIKMIEFGTLQKRTAPLALRRIELPGVASVTSMDLQRKFHESNNSFLFIDDEIWAGHELVKKVEAPPCMVSDLKTDVRIRIDNACNLIEYAPLIYNISHYFIPSVQCVSKTLKIKQTNYTIEGAACQLAASNNIDTKIWLKRFINNYIYTILVFCKKDNHSMYKRLLNFRRIQIYNKTKLKVHFEIFAESNNVTDTINKYIINDENDSCTRRGRQEVLGVIVDNLIDVEDIAKEVHNISVPVILFNGPRLDVSTKKSIWLGSGTTFHVALAFQYFVLSMNWTRVAVISDETHESRMFYKDLKDIEGFAIKDHLIEHNISENDAYKTLKQLIDENARIIFINAKYEDAVTILTAAEKYDMGNGYVWILRERRKSNSNLKLVNITYNNFIMPYQCTNCKKNGEPVTSLSDAVATLINGTYNLFKRYPHLQYDKYNDLYMREFNKILATEPIEGKTQMELRYWEHSLDPADVYMEQWTKTSRRKVGKLRVYSAAQVVIIDEKLEILGYADIQDGSPLTACLIYNSDPYLPFCYDAIALSLLAFIIILTLLYLLMGFSQPIYKKVNIVTR